MKHYVKYALLSLFCFLVFFSISSADLYVGKRQGQNGISKVSFKDFTGAQKHLTLNGVAIIKQDEFLQSDEPRKLLRLTPRMPNPKGYIAGSAFMKYLFRGFDAAYAFSTFFRYRMTGSNIYDGAGMVFVIHSDQRLDKALGKCTNCLGFGGNALLGKSIKPSIGIKFDAHAGRSDHDYNMVGLNFHGSLKSKYIHTGAFLPNGISKTMESPYTDYPINNGKVWNVWIDYDGDIIEVRSSQQDNREKATLHLRREIDMRDAMSLRRRKGEEEEPIVFVGFTADPGIFPAYTDILEWHFRPCAEFYGDFFGNKINVDENERVGNQNTNCQ